MSDVCGDNRFEIIEAYKKKLIEDTNIETRPEEMAVIDNILLRFWQMGWLPSAQPGEDIRAMCGECDAWNQYKNYPQPRWIPVTERLPKENEDIIVTYVDEEETRIIPVNYGKGTWYDCIFDTALNPIKVIAWMPLPKPWKGEENE